MVGTAPYPAPTAQSLAATWRRSSFLRGRIWEAHIKKNHQILRESIELLVDVRQAWAPVDPANSPAAATHPSNQSVQTPADDEKTDAGGARCQDRFTPLNSWAVCTSIRFFSNCAIPNQSVCVPATPL
jgi:hypothetical protein